MSSLGRWAGDELHYYDYTPDTVKREPDRDAYIVAEVFVYDAAKVERVAIRVMVTGQELHGGRLTLDDAIRRGEAVRDRAITKHRAQLPIGHRVVLCDLHGHEIETREGESP